MVTKTKIELVIRAYQAIRISSLTAQAIPEEIDMALDMMEDMMWEFESVNICTDYNFSGSKIDPNEPSGLQPYTVNAASMNLANRIANFFGKETPAGILKQAVGSLANWSSRTAKVNQINPSARQPRGSGSTLRFSNWQRYYGNLSDAPISCDTFTLKVFATDFFTVDFTPYLLEGATIVSFETLVSNGIDMLEIVQDGPIFTMKCKGLIVGYSIIELKVTTSTGRVDPQAINFNITI